MFYREDNLFFLQVDEIVFKIQASSCSTFTILIDYIGMECLMEYVKIIMARLK